MTDEQKLIEQLRKAVEARDFYIADVITQERGGSFRQSLETQAVKAGVFSA